MEPLRHASPIIGLGRVRRLFIEEIAACLADGWENVTGYPILKLASLRFVRAHDEFVEAAFGDQPALTPSNPTVREWGKSLLMIT